MEMPTTNKEVIYMRKEQSISEKRERDFTGVFIPAKLYLTNKFSPREKFLLVEIYSLRKKNKSGDCFASNRHFAGFIGVSERTVQSMLNGLKTNGYVNAWYEYEKDNPKVIHCRHLVLTEKFYEEFINEHEPKQSYEQGEKKRTGDGEKKRTSRGEETCMYKYNNELSITEEKNINQDFILPNKEKKTLSIDKGVNTSSPSVNITTIPPRTREQKEERRKQIKNNRSVDYKDEELTQILFDGFNSLYGDKEDITEDHDICLTINLVYNFFEKFKQFRGERHPIVFEKDVDQFLHMVQNTDLDIAKDEMIEEDEELDYYLDMMDEFFGTDIGQNNKLECDYHIWLFFTEKTQNILYNRVKQKREEQEE